MRRCVTLPRCHCVCTARRRDAAPTCACALGAKKPMLLKGAAMLAGSRLGAGVAVVAPEMLVGAGLVLSALLVQVELHEDDWLGGLDAACCCVEAARRQIVLLSEHPRHLAAERAAVVEQGAHKLLP